MTKYTQETKIEPSLPSERAIELIKRQMDKIEGLIKLRYDDPEVRKWDNMTEQILINSFGKPHDNLSDFNYARHGGAGIIGGEDYEYQNEFIEHLKDTKKLLEGFIEQIEIFSPIKIQIQENKITKELSNKIFIVHGHDEKARSELALILNRLGFEPIILHEQANEGKTLIEKLEKHSEVGYAFIILTPDDLGTNIDNKEDLKPRARQNVVFEFGMFVGKIGRSKVCCLYKGNIELPSDLHGLVYIPFADSLNEIQIDILKELKAAGYGVKI